MPQDAEPTCERCGKPMVIRAGRQGRFLACTGYPDCKYKRPLPPSLDDDREGPEGPGPEPQASSKGP